MDLNQLDNPVWHSLTSGHQSLAISHGKARRYPANVSPLSAVEDASAEAFADLLTLVKSGETVAFFGVSEIDVRPTWNVTQRAWIDQFVCAEVPAKIELPLVELGTADVPEMLALTAATKPGPFLPETIRMGRYFGVRDGDRLVAMAGQRLNLGSFVEISAVCTDPAYRGRGYAQGLVTFLARKVHDEGKTPFLHTGIDNPARRTYARGGFVVRRQIQVTVLRARAEL